MFFFFFLVLLRLAKKEKKSYLNKGTEVGMHDQCHRLDNPILTFLPNFLKVRAVRAYIKKTKTVLESFHIAVGFLCILVDKKREVC